MTSNPGDPHDDNPWSPERYAEAREEDRAAGSRGFHLSGQAIGLIIGMLVGIVITVVYAIYLVNSGG